MPHDDNNILNRWRRNFLAGLAIAMPGIISIAVVVWLFENIFKLTDWLLVFLPSDVARVNGGAG